MSKGGKELDRKYLFEEAPVAKALATFAIPSIISQIISMIYNIADTFFVGRTDNPYMVAAVTLSFTLFMSLTALGQLFGIGGGTLTSRLLGEYKEDEAKKIGTFSFYSSLIVCIIFCGGTIVFMDPILKFLGTSPETVEYARQYAFWVVGIGGFPTILGISLSHLIRAEGYSKEASFGLSLGGVINIVLDPLFMFVILEPGNEVLGASLATMLSNCISFIYYICIYFSIRKNGNAILSLDIRKYTQGAKYLGQILAVGFPSFIAPFLGSMATSTMNRLCSNHSDIAVAAFGIAKKIDMLPMNTSLGMCQGMVALVAYNCANKNYKRMRAFINTTRTIGICFAFVCIAVYQIFTPQIIGMFIKEQATLETGVTALRIACLSTPLMISVFHMSYTYQSMGYGFKSLMLTICRQGLVCIPLLFVMDHFFGIVGIYWTQFTCDAIVMSIAFVRYARFQKKLDRELAESKSQN